MINKHPSKTVSKLALLGMLLSTAVLLSAIISAVGYRLGWWRHPQAFSIFEWATYAGIATLCISVIAIFKIYSQEKQYGLLLSITGIILSLPVITASALFDYSAAAYPRINDITTDTQDPPSFWDAPNPVDYPGQSAASLQQAAYPDIKPLQSTVSPEKFFEQALNTVKEKDWEVIASDTEEGRIEAVVTTLFFGFKDEIVIRITPTDKGSIFDIRSRSRIGKIDRGANAKRIRQFIKKLKEKLGRIKSEKTSNGISEFISSSAISIILCEK